MHLLNIRDWLSCEVEQFGLLKVSESAKLLLSCLSARKDLESTSTPYPLQREEGSGHTATNSVVAEERTYRPLWLGNKMLTSAKHIVTYLYFMTTDAIYEKRGSDWSHQVSGVACETIVHIHVLRNFC